MIWCYTVYITCVFCKKLVIYVLKICSLIYKKIFSFPLKYGNFRNGLEKLKKKLHKFKKYSVFLQFHFKKICKRMETRHWFFLLFFILFLCWVHCAWFELLRIIVYQFFLMLLFMLGIWYFKFLLIKRH